MVKDKKNKSQKVNIVIVILPAIITALAGIIGAYFSYSAGVDAIRIPLIATQTAEAKNAAIIPTQTKIYLSPNPPIAVDSTKIWQPTGFFVSASDTVTIQVISGQWTTARARFPDELREQLAEGLWEKMQKFGYTISLRQTVMA